MKNVELLRLIRKKLVFFRFLRACDLNDHCHNSIEKKLEMSALKRKLENSDEANPTKIAKKVVTSNNGSETQLSEQGLTEDENKEKNQPDDLNEDDEDEGDDYDDAEDEDEDEDQYVADDFLVDEQGEEEEEASVSERHVKKSKSHQKLKKNTRKFLLDEDDQLLIQETIPEKGERADKAEPVEGDEIEPDVSDEESDVNDFIEDDGYNQLKPVAKRNTSRKSLFSQDGPTYDQVQEARDIFGDGYDEIGEEESFYDENDENGLKSSASKLKGEKKASGFEYIQLVQNFCLDEDEVIRETDIPERLQIYHASRDTNEQLIDEESIWILQQLKSLKLMDFSPRNSEVLVESVKTVLNFLLVRCSFFLCLFLHYSV